MPKKPKKEEDTGPAEVEVAKVDSDIHKLSANGNLDLVKVLVESKENPVDINVQDTMGCTPLIWASRGGHVNVMEYLLENGADTNMSGYGGMTALHHACNN